jgi:hypothetical protein
MVRITVPHYYDFGEDRSLVGDDLVRPEAWDALRTKTTGPFGLADTREGWDRVADDHPILGERTKEILRLVEERGGGSIASYGVGGASLECWLKRQDPDLRLLIGEYAPATVERLRDVFPEAEIHLHDLLRDPPLEADWHLFNRIDTEFTNSQWRQLLKRFGENRILVVATELIDLRDAWRELRIGMRRGTTHSGHVRNRAAFEALWRRTHQAEPVDLAGLQGWVLTPLS